MTASPGTSSSDSDAVGALGELRNDATPDDVAAVRRAAFELLLHVDEPVSVEVIAATAGTSDERTAEILEAARTRGRVECNKEGDIIGIAGLSLTPSPHELTIGDRIRWTWCALDAVGILGALATDGIVRSTDPHSGQAIEIQFESGSPRSEAHLFILSGFSKGNVRGDWCPHVNFFASAENARSWSSARSLDGHIVSVADAVAEAARRWQPVAGAAGPQA